MCDRLIEEVMGSRLLTVFSKYQTAPTIPVAKYFNRRDMRLQL